MKKEQDILDVITKIDKFLEGLGAVLFELKVEGGKDFNTFQYIFKVNKKGKK